MTNKNVQLWKIAVCVLGVLMIAGAITYVLITRMAASSVAKPNSSSAPANEPVNTPTADGVGELNWMTNLDSKYETNDYIFVVFPGNDELTTKADQAVKTAMEKIRQSGTGVDTMTLSSSAPEFQATLERLAIQKLPAVLLLAPTRQGVVVKVDITETKLLQAFLSLQKTCVPGASGCCP